MSYVTFSPMSTGIKKASVAGTVNGYKITTILHAGRTISLAKNKYYYVPFSNEIVTIRGSRAVPLTRTPEGMYSFREKLEPRGSWHFKVNASDLHQEAWAYFRG